MSADQISRAEMGAIHRNVVRYGMPGTQVGGCAALVEELSEFIRERGGVIRTASTSRASWHRPVRGVELRDRHTRKKESVAAALVVSDAGRAEMTGALLGRQIADDVPKAAGLKLHIVSDRSMIAHNGVMLCLGMRRISGMVEVSRAVPSVAPPGMAMIDTFQVMRSEDMVAERDLAQADLHDVFGDAFERHCRVVRTSAFRGRCR